MELNPYTKKSSQCVRNLGEAPRKRVCPIRFTQATKIALFLGNFYLTYQPLPDDAVTEVCPGALTSRSAACRVFHFSQSRLAR
jgi:hypothetical protein